MPPEFTDLYLQSLKRKQGQEKSIEDKIKDLKVPLPDAFGKLPASIIRQGHGSGLDADTLDGRHASYFAQSGGTFLFGDGTVSAPSIAFLADTDTGLYSPGANTINIATNGVSRFSLGTSGLTTTLPFFSAVGSDTNPTYTFDSDNNTGMYNITSDSLGFTAGGTLRLSVNSVGLTIGANNIFCTPSSGNDFFIMGTTSDGSDSKSVNMNGGGSASASRGAGVGYYGNEYSGAAGLLELYAGNVAGGKMTIGTGGSNRITLDTTSFTSTLPFYGPLGSNSAPTFTFASDTNSGMYSESGGDSLSFTVGGTRYLNISSGGILNYMEYILNSAGTNTTPTYTFSADTDTGMYRGSSGDNLNLATGGNQVWNANSNGVITTPRQSSARAYRSGNQDIASAGTYTKLQFNAKTYDVRGEFDSSTNYRYTAVVAGKYQFNAIVLFAGVTITGQYIVNVYKNGASYCLSVNYGTVADSLTGQVSDVVDLAVNDYLEVFVSVATAGNDVVGGETLTAFSVHKLA